MKHWLVDVVIGGIPQEIWATAPSLEAALTSAELRYGDVIPVRDEDGEPVSIPSLPPQEDGP